MSVLRVEEERGEQAEKGDALSEDDSDVPVITVQAAMLRVAVGRLREAAWDSYSALDVEQIVRSFANLFACAFVVLYLAGLYYTQVCAVCVSMR